MKNSLDAALRIAFFLLAFACLLSLRLNSVVEPSDDSYITLRTVQNLLHGKGFVYNVGERVLGTTTPLYTLLVDGISKGSGVEPVSVARGFGLFCDLLNLLLFFILASAFLRKPLFLSGIASLMYALCWNTTVSSVLLMETPFFVCLLLLTCVCSLRDTLFSRGVASAFAALSCLVRPEGAILLFSVLVYRSFLVERRRFKIPYPELLIASIVLLPWIVFSLSYFGSPVPHSVVAKRIAYLRPFFGTGMSFSAHFSRIVSAHYMAWYVTVFFLGAGLYLVWSGGKALIRGNSPLQIPLLFLLTFLLSYTVANPSIFEWYLSPLEPIYVLLMFAGLQALWNRRLLRLPLTLYFFIVSVNLFAQYPSALHLESSSSSSPWIHLARGKQEDFGVIRPFRAFEEREYIYIRIASMLQNTGSDASVLAPEFGAFGYFSSARIISAIGHVNPEVLSFLPAPKSKTALDSAIPVAMVVATRPDYIFSLEIFIRHTLLKDPWFRRHYEVVKIFPSSMFYSKGVYLFRRLEKERVTPTAVASIVIGDALKGS